MKFKFYFLSLLLISLGSCTEDASIPRPRGYFRIDLPEKQYQMYSSDCPFVFEIPSYSVMSPGSAGDAQPCWLNLQFPKQKATLHLSYKEVQNNGNQMMEDSRNMAYKHAVKANGIEEKVFENLDENVYGIMYKISGNAASSVQFYVTDNDRHFLRGSLYFYSSPNADSLQPVTSFIREDIEHLVSTLRWK
ncbi:MAG: gliding motility lipoprotein GldD [Bacteroidia bacterium]